jgi:ribosome maturation factor RimP
MNFFVKNIQEQIEHIVNNKGFFLIDLVLRGERNNRVIEVYVDSEINVSAEDCAEISRDIDKHLEEENIFESGYRLEVSSPGVSRPLKFLKQFPKHINRKFDISYRDLNSVKKVTGTLKNIAGNDLVFIKSNREEIRIEFDKIIKAKVLISFS